MNDADIAAAAARAAELIAQADALIVAAGAGMGVDSGLPDFRGREGFWNAYPALAEAKLDFYAVASPDTFERDPALAWGFYGHRLALYRKTRPHAGFALLRAWDERMLHGCSVFTSNVDGHFQRAGFDADAVHECHGAIDWLQCMVPCGADIWPADAFVPEVDTARCRLVNEPPRCPRCGGLARPNILMFGDDGWIARRTNEQARRQRDWLDRVERPVVIELGAGTAVPSVRHFSEQVIHALDGRLVRVNPREFRVPTSGDVALACGALAGLQAIAAVLG